MLQFLHWAANTKIDKNDKAWKFRRVMDKLNENFMGHFVPDEHINFDESIIVSFFWKKPFCNFCFELYKSLALHICKNRFGGPLCSHINTKDGKHTKNWKFGLSRVILRITILFFSAFISIFPLIFHLAIRHCVYEYQYLLNLATLVSKTTKYIIHSISIRQYANEKI